MPMWGFEVGFALFGLASVVEARRRWRRYRWAACRWCGGTGKKYEPGKGRKHWGECRHCGETGTRLRAGAKIQGGRRDER